MRRGVGWYRRRVPWVGQPPGASVAPPRPTPSLVISSSSTHRGRVVQSRPPLQAPVVAPSVRPQQPLVVSLGAARAGKVITSRPPSPKGTPPRPQPALVLRQDAWRRGQVTWARPPLKLPPANVAGAVRPAQVRRYEIPLGLRQGKVWQSWLPYGRLGPAGPAVRQLLLKARADNQVVLKAGVRTTYSLKGSATMSISAKLTFFQGEDITLNFALTPPQDITGWTLTGTIKNQLGGTTQFTFTPTILDTGRGVFQVVWPRGNTGSLGPGDYVWDVRRTDSGNNSVLAHGEITVKQPVTS